MDVDVDVDVDVGVDMDMDMRLILLVFHRNCGKLNELSGQSIVTLWDALWLGIGPFFWFYHDAFKHKKHAFLVGPSYCRRFQIVEN